MQKDFSQYFEFSSLICCNFSSSNCFWCCCARLLIAETANHPTKTTTNMFHTTERVDGDEGIEFSPLEWIFFFCEEKNIPKITITNRGNFFIIKKTCSSKNSSKKVRTWKSSGIGNVEEIPSINVINFDRYLGLKRTMKKNACKLTYSEIRIPPQKSQISAEKRLHHSLSSRFIVTSK